MTVSDGDSRRVPNLRLSRARQGMPSPSGSGQQMSPHELAEAVNAYVWHRHGKQVHLDRSYISKLEVDRIIQRQGDGFPLDQSCVAYLRYLRRERRQSPRSEADADHVKVETEMLQRPWSRVGAVPDR